MLTAKIAALEKEVQTQLAQIQRLLSERDSISASHFATKEALLAQEKAFADYKAATALLNDQEKAKTENENITKERLDEATKKVLELTDQASVLHKALQKAKQVTDPD